MRIDLGPDLAAAKAAALAQVDEEAELTRLCFLTPGAGQAMEYAAAEADARAYIEAFKRARTLESTPVSADYPFLHATLESERDARGGVAPDPLTMAGRIASGADKARGALAEIRRLRLAAKAKVTSAQSHAEIRAAARIAWPQP